jgi:cytidine deaminase
METVMDVENAELITAAREARDKAYAPYSNYRVGAAVITGDGVVFTGCNVENASYPASICAERVAITKAVSEGYYEFQAIAIATENGGAPCGICRQVMFQFAPDMRVLLVDDEAVTGDFTLSDLLPHGFGPDSLPDSAPR